MGAHRSNSTSTLTLTGKVLAVSLAVVLSTGCGDTPLQATIAPASAAADEDCLNCGLEPQPDPEVLESAGDPIDVFPMELTFFLDEMPEELLVEQTLTIENSSRDTIRLLAGDLFQSSDILDRAFSGSFELVNPAIFPLSLRPAESVTMVIKYRPATDQSAGLVVIATNHPAQPFLFVSVIGKVFL